MDVSNFLRQLKSEDDKEKGNAISRLSRIAFRNPEVIIPAILNFKEGLNSQSPEIVSKSAWAIGQVAHKRADLVSDFVPMLTSLFQHKEAKVRCNAVWAVGRIGRANDLYVKRHMNDIFSLATDEELKVRQNMIWACENIATNYPELIEHKLGLFQKMLFDSDVNQVRREAPEIFRVLGVRIPSKTAPYLSDLQKLLSDNDKVVRIHAEGAIKSINKGLS